MTLEEFPWVYNTDAAAQSHTQLEQHFFTLPSLPPIMKEYVCIMKSIIETTVAVIIMVTIISIF